MILTNKLIRFPDSFLAKTIYILDVIKFANYSVLELYNEVKTYFDDINEYVLALDVLYTLEKVKYDDDLQVIQYVEKNNV